MVIVSTITTSMWKFQAVPTTWPPLLTIFTPPAPCATRWIYDDTTSSRVYSGDAHAYYKDAVASDYFYECNPYRQEQRTPRYSPGVCGDGQTPAEIEEVRSDFVYWLAYCCPSGMSYRTVESEYGGYYCDRTFSETMTVLSRFTTTTTYSLGSTSILTLIDTTKQVCPTGPGPCSTVSVNSKTVLTTGIARAIPTIVYWQSSDLSLFPRDYGSSIAAVIGVSFDSAITSRSLLSTSAPPITSQDTNSGPSTSASPIESQNKTSGLSPGAKAGIGVGVGIFVILGVIFLLFLWRRRKQQRQQKQDAQQHEQEPSGEIGVSQMDGDANGSKRFLSGHWRAETEGSSAPVEAGSTSVNIIPGPPVELDGTHNKEGESEAKEST